MSGNPQLCGIATAVPPNVLRQPEAKSLACRTFAGQRAAVERLLPVFDHSGVLERRTARPLEWYDEEHSFPAKNAVYCEVAADLAERCGREALERARVRPCDVAGLVFVSSTGIATPSLDATLIPRLRISPTVARMPLWGLGCAGGAAGLGRAAVMARGLQAPVLLVAVELCSVTLLKSDHSKSNVVATALFGDGAAAAVLSPTAAATSSRGPEIIAGHSRLLEGTRHVMGWTLRSDGLEVRFARNIPSIVHEEVPGFVGEVAEQLARVGVAAPTAGPPAGAGAGGTCGGVFEHFALHPGGAKVLRAYEDLFGAGRPDIAAAWSTLADYGNMSSPTVLFVLDRLLRQTTPRRALGLVLGLGPGFSIEGVSFRW